MTTVTLYDPPDVREAWLEWKASCGPAALAAAIRCPVQMTRELFPEYRGWVNPTHMLAALRQAGVEHRTPRPGESHPCRGLMFVQFLGPWMDPSVPIAARYKRTHWVAVVRTGAAERLIWDVNSETGWMLFEQWCEVLVPQLLDHNRGATGWRVAKAIELIPRESR